MIDHLVYIVSDLEQATSAFTEKFGLQPKIGGRHPDRGTHNALLKMDEDSYFELLAIDPQSQVPPPRWMGIDLANPPAITRWALNAGAKIVEKAALLSAIHGELGGIKEGQRKLSDGSFLNWSLTEPGHAPAVSVVPFLIDWKGGPHPSAGLNTPGISLLELRLFHPQPHLINPILEGLGVSIQAEAGPTEKIEALIKGPGGEGWI